MLRLRFGWGPVLAGAVIFALAGGGVPAARGAGLQLLEQSPRLTGTAYSGTAAWAEDASMAFFNPAGLTRLEGGSLVVGGYLIDLGLDLKAQEASAWGQDISGKGGAMSVEAGSVVAFPVFHVAQRIDEDWVGYLGVTVPFGNNTNYADDSVARYMGTLSKLQTININPAVAWEPMDGFSVAVGFNAMYARARLNQSLALPTYPIFEGLDTQILVRGEDWAFGWNAGLLYEPSTDWRVGIAYRSAVHSTLTGDANIFLPTLIPELAKELGGLAGTTINVPSPEPGTSRFGLTSPQSLTLSVFATPVEWLDVMADFQWTQWSGYQELSLSIETQSFRPLPEVAPDFRIESIDLPPETLKVAFRDGLRGTIGAQVRPVDGWTLRMGTGYDRSPVHNANRTVRLPDANRILLSFGVGWEFLENSFIDFGYAHFFAEDGTVDQINTTPDQSQLSGQVEVAANVFGLQFTYNWKHLPWEGLPSL